MSAKSPPLRCPSCVTRFRIDLQNLDKRMRCRRCETRLEVSGETNGTYIVRPVKAEVATAPKPVESAEPANGSPHVPSQSYNQTMEGVATPSATPAILPATTPTPLPGRLVPGITDSSYDRTLLGQQNPGEPAGASDNPFAAGDFPGGPAPVAKSPARTTGGRSGGAGGKNPLSGSRGNRGARPETPGPSTGGGKRARIIIISLAGIVVLAGAALAVSFLFQTEKGLGNYGGIEIGSSGIKLVAMNVTKKNNEVEFRFLKRPAGRLAELDVPFDRNTRLGELPPKADTFDQGHLDDTIAAVEKFYRTLRDVYDIPDSKIHIIASTGVFKDFKNELKERVPVARDRLNTLVRGKTGKDVDFLTNESEVKNTILGILADNELASTCVLDFGGNTKGGMITARGEVLTFELDSGLYRKRLEKETADRRLTTPEEITAAAEELREEFIGKKLRDALAKDRMGEVMRCKNVILTGGGPWAMSVHSFPVEYFRPADKTDDFYYRRPAPANAILDYADMLRGHTRAENRSGVLEKIEASTITDPELDWKAAARQDLDKVQGEVFKKDEALIASSQVLVEFDKQFELTSAGTGKKTFVYRWGPYAVISGYLREKAAVGK